MQALNVNVCIITILIKILTADIRAPSHIIHSFPVKETDCDNTKTLSEGEGEEYAAGCDDGRLRSGGSGSFQRPMGQNSKQNCIKVSGDSESDVTVRSGSVALHRLVSRVKLKETEFKF